MKNPPKNRNFLGLVDVGYGPYWDIFFWATKEDGVQKACYVDTELFDMPDLIRWTELPEIKEEDYNE